MVIWANPLSKSLSYPGRRWQRRNAVTQCSVPIAQATLRNRRKRHASLHDILASFWHFIGTLQSNKSQNLAAIPNLYCVQTLGSIKAANALNKALPSERTTTKSSDPNQHIWRRFKIRSPSPHTFFKPRRIKLAKYVITQPPLRRPNNDRRIGTLARRRFR